MDNKNDKEKKSWWSEYRPYFEWVLVFGVTFASILCFLPICNGTFGNYSELTSPSPEAISQEEADAIKKENAEAEDETKDSLEMQREVSDVVNEFLTALKNQKYEDAYKYLDKPEYTNEEASLKYDVEYNKDFAFFRSYLESYTFEVKQVTFLEGNGAAVKVRIKRYDINRLVNKLISEKLKEGIDLENSTYEEVLFEYERYLRDEFQKSNVYTREAEYLVTLRKDENDTYKIVNDDLLDTNIINLEFRIVKDMQTAIEKSKTEASLTYNQ